MDTTFDKLTIFVERLKKININLELVGNYPWIYIDKINGKRVTEKFRAEHGFTIAFLPIRNNQEIILTDLNEIFKLIRKYNENK
jgi:hypothetical protein